MIVRDGTNFVCSKEGKIIGEYFYDADLKCFVAIPRGGLPHYCNTAIDAIDIIEQVQKEKEIGVYEHVMSAGREE